MLAVQDHASVSRRWFTRTRVGVLLVVGVFLVIGIAAAIRGTLDPIVYACYGDKACTLERLDAPLSLPREERLEHPLWEDTLALRAALEREHCPAALELADDISENRVLNKASAAHARLIHRATRAVRAYCKDKPSTAPTLAPEDAIVQLSRSGCEGECPAYSVTVQASGQVTFVGKFFVQRKDTVEYRIPPARAQRLFATFERFRFLQTAAKYTPKNPDFSRETLMLTRGTESRTVTESTTCADVAAIADGLCYLARQVDAIAQTELYIGPR